MNRSKRCRACSTTAPTGDNSNIRRISARERYLDVAVDLADSSAASLPSRHFAVAHVSIADVARTASVSRGAVYRLWPSQLEFWNDLIDFLLRHVDDDTSPAACAELATHVDMRVDVGFEAVLDAAQDALLTATLPLVRAGVVGYPSAQGSDDGDPAAHELLDGLARQIDDQLAFYRRRCVDGVTSVDLAALSVSLGNGLAVTGRMVPARDLTLDSPMLSAGKRMPRSLLGAAVGAVCRTLTAADPDPSTRREHRRPRATPDSARGGAPRSRGNRSERRRHYLRIAASLALDSTEHADYRRVLGNVSLDGLARAAHVTRRALTNVWPDVAQFRLDLFGHLLRRERRWVEAAISGASDHDSPRLGADATFFAVGDRIHEQLLAHAGGASFLAYAPVLDQRDVAERALREHLRHVDRCERQLRTLLVSLGRRPVPGVPLRHLALGLLTLADGANRVVRSDPTLLRPHVSSRHGEHSILGHASAAILGALTEPLDDIRRVNRLSAFLS